MTCTADILDELERDRIALRRDNARLRAWLRRWKCRFCCGSGVVAARRVGGYKDPAGRPCDGCDGSGLYPFASAALAGKPVQRKGGRA